jgi:hypothetical protein
LGALFKGRPVNYNLSRDYFSRNNPHEIRL